MIMPLLVFCVVMHGTAGGARAAAGNGLSWRAGGLACRASRRGCAGVQTIFAASVDSVLSSVARTVTGMNGLPSSSCTSGSLAKKPW